MSLDVAMTLIMLSFCSENTGNSRPTVPQEAGPGGS